MLSTHNMIMNTNNNYTKHILQDDDSIPTPLKYSSTPTNPKAAQKIQKKIRKESASSTSATAKGTQKQQQQLQLQEKKQVVAQLTSPSWSDKTVNLTSQTSSSSLPQKILINVSSTSSSLNGQCFANMPQQQQLQQVQQQQQQQQSQFQASSKKKNQTKISPRSQTSSLTSEISSFDLYSYNDCVGSSTSSTNQAGMHHHNHNLNHPLPLSSVNPHDGLPLQQNQINFSPIISAVQEPFQQIAPLDALSTSCSPKSRIYCEQRIVDQSSLSGQKSNLNNMHYNSNNNCYNTEYSASSPKMQQQYYSNYSTPPDQIISNPNPATRLVNWNVLPIEIQRATFDMNGKIEEVQRNFDNCVSMIEMPFDKNYAYQKVKEAQQLQEQSVYQLTNVNEGISLSEAVENLIKNLQRRNNGNSTITSCLSGESAKFGNSHSNEGSSAAASQLSSVQLAKNPSTKQKKISKKASKSEKNASFNLQSEQQQMNEENYSQMASNNISQIGQTNGNACNENGIQYNNNSINYNSNSYNYLPDMNDQEMANKEADNNIASSFQNVVQSSRVHPLSNVEFNEHPSNLLNSHSVNNNQNLDMYPNLHSNKNGIPSPRKAALSMQGYDDEVMSQQELMNNYDNLDGALSVIYEDDNAYYNQQDQSNLMATNFKKDDDDTLYGYVSQNDTIEDLINSQSKCKPKQANFFASSNSNINNFVSTGFYNSTNDEDMNSRVYSRNVCGTDQYYNSSIPPYGNNMINSHSNNSVESLESFAANTKQRTSSVATTDLHTAASQRKIDFEHSFEGNHSLFNKNC